MIEINLSKLCLSQELVESYIFLMNTSGLHSLPFCSIPWYAIARVEFAQTKLKYEGQEFGIPQNRAKIWEIRHERHRLFLYMRELDMKARNKMIAIKVGHWMG